MATGVTSSHCKGTAAWSRRNHPSRGCKESSSCCKDWDRGIPIRMLHGVVGTKAEQSRMRRAMRAGVFTICLHLSFLLLPRMTVQNNSVINTSFHPLPTWECERCLFSCYLGKRLSAQASIFKGFLGVSGGTLPRIGILTQMKTGLSGEWGAWILTKMCYLQACHRLAVTPVSEVVLASCHLAAQPTASRASSRGIVWDCLYSKHGAAGWENNILYHHRPFLLLPARRVESGLALK